MSFNSPPATEREQQYYEGEYADEEVDYANYYCEEQPGVFKRNSYMNIQNYESSDKNQTHAVNETEKQPK